MRQRDILRTAVWTGLWVAVLLLAAPHTAPAQITAVNLTIPGFDYDVLYISDFIDVTSSKLTSNIPGFSGTMTAVPAGASGSIYLVMSATMQLQGQPLMQLADATTNPFTLNGSRTISARNLAKGGVGDITIASSNYHEEGKNTLEKYVERFPSAPTGVYTLMLRAYRAGTNVLLGSVVKQINIRNSSPNEVVVTLIDPLPGAVIPTVLPTFTWSSPYPDVTLRVYEKLPIHHSPEEAITGIPFLIQPLSGLSTFTYPASASRHLEIGKTYVWYVTTRVKTNRGTVDRASEIRVFRLFPPNQTLADLLELMNSLGGDGLGTITTLLNMGWVPNGDITLDGITLSGPDVVKLLKQLAAQNTSIAVRVE